MSDKKAPFHATEIRLPDGTVLDLSEWSNESFRSALFVNPWSAQNVWELFVYSRGVAIPGTDIVANRAHTNIPRSGDSGLPLDWAMYVLQWRAALNMTLEQPVLDWAAETVVQFEYNGKYYGNTPLIDLLLGARPVGDPLPVHMRENLGFKVTVSTDNERAVAQLRDWLRGGGSVLPENVRDAVTELDAILRLQPEGPVAASLRHVQAKLRPGRHLMAWIHLEGPVKRVLV